MKSTKPLLGLAPARAKPEGERKAKKPEAAAPKTTVKRAKKVVKEDGGEKKE